jgi:hypothetical protein
VDQDDLIDALRALPEAIKAFLEKLADAVD